MPTHEKQTVWILGDQLSLANAALARAEKKHDVVLMMESQARGSGLKYHKKKLVLVYASMRHFARELTAKGWTVDFHRLEDTSSFEEGMKRHLQRHRPSRVLLTAPNSIFEEALTAKLARQSGFDLETVETRQFLCGREEFRAWAGQSRRLLMEMHYRRMRKKLGYLMTGDEPAGGQWNFDADNRRTRSDWEKAERPLPPTRPALKPDAITRKVIKQVDQFFPDHPGETKGFWLPVSRPQARKWLRHFVENRLPRFGDYEDIMVRGQPELFHSVLSTSLNLGLLTPAECCEAALDAYEKKEAPLNAVEGFIRQIIGWREFVNGIYWLKGEAYQDLNHLEAERPLPEWLYTGRTEMNCLRQTIGQVLDLGYNHHIQRLMVLGNFFLLAEIRPREVLRWFLEMYVDAFDWVMAANVIGMICHADGGFMATKPYAASAAYINKMSDYCRDCRYSPIAKTGADACPFNHLYWNFYDRHARLLARNPRVKMMLSSWKKRKAADRQAVLKSAGEYLSAEVPRG